jgi:hypothetical protein
MPTILPRITGTIWLVLLVLKLANPRNLVSHLDRLLGSGARSASLSAGLLIALEGAIAIAMLFTRRTARLRWVTVGSLLLALAILAGTLIGPVAGDCGCFGGLIAASSSRRIVVSATLVLTSAIALHVSLDRGHHDPSA